MKTKFILIVLLFVIRLNAFSTIELNCYQPGESSGSGGSQSAQGSYVSPDSQLSQGSQVAQDLQGSQGAQDLVRTFKPKTILRPGVPINFKAALFSITKSSVGVMSNAPFYSLYFDGKIDIAPGGNKFWDLAGNAEIIDEIDNHIGLGSQTISGFKDCNYNKSVFLTVLGQSIMASEYYYLDVDMLYAKGMSVAAQIIHGSGITINVPDQEVLYSPSKPVCYFPLTYDGTTHTISPYTRTIIAKVSGASALGIPDGTPVSYSVTFNDNYKVLAWGGLQLIDNEKPVNALLVQAESKSVGTISINGAKVPQSVLSSLKMTQDSASVSVNYSFRNMTYLDNIAEFGLDGNKVTYLTTIKTIKGN